MEIATIQVTGVRASLVGHGPGRWEIPAGLIGGTIRLVYGPDWAALSKTVVFSCGNVTKDVVDAGEVVTVPAEVTAKPERKLLVGVYGVDETGETAIPTLWLEGYVRSAADPSGDPTTDPALPVWAQLEQRIAALEDRETYCSVTNLLEHVTSDNTEDRVARGSAYSARLLADEGFALTEVNVTMGGMNITASCYGDGRISIPAVSGNITVKAFAAASASAEYVDAALSCTAGFALDSNGALTSATDKWMYSNYIPAVEGQTFRYFGDTSAYNAYPSVCGYDEAGNFVAIQLDNGSFGAGETFTVSAGVKCLRCCYYVGNEAAFGLQMLESEWLASGEVSFLSDITVNATGAETAKVGGGATDFLPASVNAEVIVYNMIPNNGGRVVIYDAQKNFLEELKIYTSGDMKPAVVAFNISNENAAYIRISTNVLSGVKATVRENGA